MQKTSYKINYNIYINNVLIGSYQTTDFGFSKSYLKFWYFIISLGFPGGSDGKESACNAANPGSIPGLGIISLP